MKKRLLSALLCVVMVTAMLPFAAASDLDGHWAKTYVEYMDREGVINPSATTGKYEPDRDMTRAEFMRYINRAFHFEETAAISFSDVPRNAWYYETIQIAVKYGYINGVGDNMMEPEGKVTREQAAVIIGRLFKADPGSISPSDLPFSDNSSISDWGAGYIKAAVDKGFLSGYEDGTFQPQRVVSRGEVAKVLYYYMGTALSSPGKAYTGADLKGDTTNVTISESCTLSDAVVEGDLYISEGLGSKAVTLNNVTVKGTMIVSGGTVTMMNTSSDHMIVSSPMGRLLQVTATGATHIGQTEVQTSATLYEKWLGSAKNDGFASVSVRGKDKVSLTLDAAVDELALESASTVSTTEGTQIYHMSVGQDASVTGQGSVYHADIQTGDVSFASSVTVSGYTLANGVAATIGGQKVSESSVAGVIPKTIAVDLGNPSALGEGVAISVPSGLTVSSVSCDGRSLTEEEYTKTATGVTVSADYLTSLSKGEYTLQLQCSNGRRESVKVSVTDKNDQAAVQSAVFDRYYASSEFRDVRVKLSGVTQASDVQRVVLGMSEVEYTFDSATRSLVLRRGVLARLRAGTYTVSVDLKNGKTSLFNLTVADSTPSGMWVSVAEYDADAPAELRFALALGELTVRSVSAMQEDGTAAELQADTDYTVASDGLTLTQSGLDKFRGSDLVELTVTRSDDAVYTLVIDYI